METPVWNFVRRYAESGTARLHMPGHKGIPFLGCEPLDITEITGTDSLTEQSEANAAALFGSARTLYSTGGSSQCVRAMVWLAAQNRGGTGRPLFVAARNAHKSFLYAAVLVDAEILWLWPESHSGLCSCPVSPERLEQTLWNLPFPPAAVFLTSPDYLGGMQNIRALSSVAHRFGVPLLVDNAHGAYLRFLNPSAHPLDFGADLCCGSAHKTLPVLTGGAYLHIALSAPPSFCENAQNAMELFASTSPSWLILASLDRCNADLSDGYPERLAETVRNLDKLRHTLRAAGWTVEESDPLRITLRGDSRLMTDRLRRGGFEWEYADRDTIVLMVSPEIPPEHLRRAADALGRNPCPGPPPVPPACVPGEQVLPPRQALFAQQERLPVHSAIGRVCGAPCVSCPPAVPPVVSGERIGPEAAALCEYYGIKELSVVK